MQQHDHPSIRQGNACIHPVSRGCGCSDQCDAMSDLMARLQKEWHRLHNLSLDGRSYHSMESATLIFQAAEHVERLEAENARLREILLKTRAIVVDGSMTGFNVLDGDWAERLYANNGAISAALAGKAVSHD